ncbi:MAG: 23S rRNA (cytidine(2498)-2'-O)-methyltransferase RlmM [Betaproteobacteria bacterium HGW-Betaproteobacteria-13]|nr:MAG: 23S rRNA (cytidine(2498)-2'-O)-methyltransferase RlmM [Betaproteobacteria bacterium HGW-Betaproteobacteria-13]
MSCDPSHHHDTSARIAISGLLAYCRPGFEKELASELDDIAADAGMIGFVRTQPNSGYAAFEAFEPVPVSTLGEHADWRKPVFARQLLPWFAKVDDLPERDRATPIVAAVHASGQRFSGVVLETPDNDEAKQQSGFCRRFAEPLTRALEKAGRLRTSKTGLPLLHVVFTSPTTAWLASGLPGMCAPWPMGIPRLRMPSNAPSRSTLKLAEAFMTLLSDEERENNIRAGQRAVDLGAAPGGWTWQLANRGLRVIAVDNGPMKDSVMADWVATGRCRHTIFNLKLPMKRRLEAVEQCRILIQKRLASVGPYDLRIKQLYHDREEVTAYLTLKR